MDETSDPRPATQRPPWAPGSGPGPVTRPMTGPASGTASGSASGNRTAPGRRPVLRAPSTAQGIRTVDDTGALSGIVPLSRPGAGAGQESIEIDLSSAVAIPVMSDEILDAEGRRQADLHRESSADEAAEPPVVADGPEPEPEPELEPEPDGIDEGVESADPAPPTSRLDAASDAAKAPEADARTILPALLPAREPAAAPVARTPIIARSAGSAAEARTVTGSAPDSVGSDDGDDDPQVSWHALPVPPPMASRREERDPGEPAPPAAAPAEYDELDDEDDDTPNPAVTVVKLLVLALVAAVIAGLVWLLATGALTDGAEALGGMAAARAWSAIGPWPVGS